MNHTNEYYNDESMPYWHRHRYRVCVCVRVGDTHTEREVERYSVSVTCTQRNTKRQTQYDCCSCILRAMTNSLIFVIVHLILHVVWLLLLFLLLLSKILLFSTVHSCSCAGICICIWLLFFSFLFAILLIYSRIEPSTTKVNAVFINSIASYRNRIYIYFISHTNLIWTKNCWLYLSCYTCLHGNMCALYLCLFPTFFSFSKDKY